MLLRLAYLGLTNTFAMLRLLPMTDQYKDIEILVLRHQIAVLQRQLSDTRVRFSPALAENLIRADQTLHTMTSTLSTHGLAVLRQDDRPCCYDWPTLA